MFFFIVLALGISVIETEFPKQRRGKCFITNSLRYKIEFHIIS